MILGKTWKQRQIEIALLLKFFWMKLKISLSIMEELQSQIWTEGSRPLCDKSKRHSSSSRYW